MFFNIHFRLFNLFYIIFITYICINKNKQIYNYIMINLIKNNSNGVRKNLFLNLKSLGAPKTTRNGVEVIVIESGDNVANIFENGLVNFSGFKSINEVISVANK